MLLIFYLLIVFKMIKYVKMKNQKKSINKKIFKKFGKILRQKRREKNLTQEELADLAGIHRTYVAGIEGGYRNPSLKNIIKLGNALGIKIKKLFEEF